MRTTGLTILFFLLSAGGIFLADDPATPSFPLLDKKIVFNFPVVNAPTTQKKSSVIDTTELKNSSWYGQVIKNIEESEYEIKYEESTHSYASPNRKQNLRAFYAGDQFTLLPRNDSTDKWKLTLRLKGIYAGRDKLYAIANDPAVTQNENSIQFNHNNQFITEYVNSKEGVRQNFIISHKPAGNTKKLRIELEANKGWFINKVHDREIHFAKATKDGYDKKITYNGLKVWDANGKELEAAFAVNKNTVSINVNVNNGVYPITVDPLSTGTAGTPDWIGDDANQANVFLGNSVASAGDVNGDGYSDVIIGASRYDDGSNTDEGMAFVYYGSAAGLSATPSSIPDDADQATAYFGSSVASAGDVDGDGYSDVIISATGYDNGANIDEGWAFVYHGSPTGLSATPNSTFADANQGGAFFGNSVASAGDINDDGYSDVIIGAYRYDDGANTNEGRAFVYYGSSTGLSATPNRILDDANQTGAFFGRSVACAGDVNGDGFSDVIIGAEGYDDGANSEEGQAFVYYGSASGLSVTPSMCILDDANQGGAFFGNSVASAGDVNGDGYSDVIIGAYRYNDGSNFSEGRAFVYYGSAIGLSATPNSTPDDADQGGAEFGNSVAAAGDINGDGYSDVIIGTALYDEGANTDEGRAFVYYGSGSGLTTSPNSTLDDADQIFAYFGTSVASAGDVNGDGYSDVIIGANGYDDAGNTDEGWAFVYHGGPDGLSASPLNTPDDANQAFANFGVSVASAGDVNGDGYSDVIIGAWRFDDGFTDEGVAFVYHGSTTGLSATPNSILDDANQANVFFAEAVACAGDVNGDGYSDVIIGADNYTDLGNTAEGRAFVYHGGPSGLASTPASLLDDADQAFAFFGVSVAGAGDVNGDGYADVIVGAIGMTDGGNANEGRAYIYHGSATGLNATPNSTPDDADQAGAWFGWSVAGAGDVNGDGYSDVIIGALTYDDGFTDEGKAFVYHGGPTGLSLTPNNIPDDANQASAQFGESVACAGDVNGDGYSDVIIGAKLYDDGFTDEGRAFIYYGSSTGLNPSPGSTPDDADQAGAHFGISVASAGDVNGDGYSDVIIGARYYDDGFANEGRAFVYYGSPTGLSAAPNSTPDDADQANTDFGYTVACAGDINGDGYSDVIVGAFLYDGGLSDEGQAFVYYGNNAGGLRNNLRLYNQDLTTPIQQSSIGPALFGAGLYAKSPLGRQKGKLVWETVKNGQPFSGIPITNSTAFLSQQSVYTDLTITGIELKNQIAKQFNSVSTYIRARVKYDPVTAITGQVYGPWRYPESFLWGNRDIGAVVLPVKFISFVALKQNDNRVLLKWITTDETPGIEYEVQHSTDGIHFQTIQNINGAGNSRNDYEWLHNNPSTGKNFYRIHAIENGKEAFTAIRQINFDKNIRLIIYPNPAKSGSQLTIELTNNPASGNWSAELFSINGQKKAGYSIAAGNNNFNIILPELPVGGYILKLVKDRREMYSGSFVVVQ